MNFSYFYFNTIHVLFVGNGAGASFESRTFTSTPKVQPGPNFGHSQSPYPNIAPNVIPPNPNLGVLNQPLVQDMALQYGQQVKYILKMQLTLSNMLKCVNVTTQMLPIW